MVRGKHDKFWQIEVDGEDVHLWWGRRGTKGQKKIKTFQSSDNARSHAKGLISQKLAKGYTDVTPESEAGRYPIDPEPSESKSDSFAAQFQQFVKDS